jgi:hypothetical protein
MVHQRYLPVSRTFVAFIGTVERPYLHVLKHLYWAHHAVLGVVRQDGDWGSIRRAARVALIWRATATSGNGVHRMRYFRCEGIVGGDYAGMGGWHLFKRMMVWELMKLLHMKV